MIRQLTFEYSASTASTLGSEGCVPARATWVFIDVSVVEVDGPGNCRQLRETLSTALRARVRKPGLGPQGLRARTHARRRLHCWASPESKTKVFGEVVVRIRE
jgi:hypothetical protein